jgi:hypothetical protein
MDCNRSLSSLFSTVKPEVSLWITKKKKSTTETDKINATKDSIRYDTLTMSNQRHSHTVASGV